MTKNDALHFFEYRNGILYWKETTNPKKISVGDKAGTINKIGRTKIQLNKKIYFAHRLIFLMHFGYMPKVVDHIDGNVSNDRIENLRDATVSQNQYNAIKRVDNKSGSKNVCWHKRSKKWGVSISVNGSIKHIGYFQDYELAELVSQEARNKFHGTFACHGFR